MRTKSDVAHWFELTLDESEQFSFRPFAMSPTFRITEIKVGSDYFKLIGDYCTSLTKVPRSSVVQRNYHGDVNFAATDEVSSMPPGVAEQVNICMEKVRELNQNGLPSSQ